MYRNFPIIAIEKFLNTLNEKQKEKFLSDFFNDYHKTNAKGGKR